MGTKIEWTKETWNPIIGCSKISPGCDNCYAERMAKRLCAMGQENYFSIVNPNGWTGNTFLAESALEKPFHWKKSRTIFVSSMGDLFHKTVSFKDLHLIFSIIANNPQHTFLILTKRAETMAQYFRAVYPEYESRSTPIPNVWLGVTAENQEQADKRIPILLQIPAAKRFVSIEPMLRPVDLKHINTEPYGFTKHVGPPEFHHINALTGYKYTLNHKLKGAGTKQFPALDWVICGGESGPGARPMHPYWARSLRDQCQEAGVPFFFKQWGEWHPNWQEMSRPDLDYNQIHTLMDNGISMCRVGKKRAGRKLDGKIWNQKP